MQETLTQPVSAPSAETNTHTQDLQEPVSTNTVPVAEQTSESNNDAKLSAEPSAAGDKDANKRASLLDVVKAAYKAKPDSGSSTEGDKMDAKAASNAEASGSLDDDQAPKDASQQTADKVPFHNHPRWKEMLSERDALKPKADQYEKITTFMQNAGLSSQEMADGMHVMAMMKTNPVEAYKALQGYITKIAPLAGEVLPEDLKREVDDGFINEDRAKELARLKAEREFSSARNVELQQRIEAEANASRGREMHDAVAQWEITEKAKDPDWSVKQEMVLDRVKVMLMTERPSNPSEATELARRALADVNARLRPALSRNTTLRSPTSSLSSANTRPKPSSLEDLVRLGLNT